MADGTRHAPALSFRLAHVSNIQWHSNHQSNSSVSVHSGLCALGQGKALVNQKTTSCPHCGDLTNAVPRSCLKRLWKVGRWRWIPWYDEHGTSISKGGCFERTRLYRITTLHKIVLSEFQSVDLTELAKQGKLDPTIGREEGTKFFLAPVPLPHFSL